MTDGSEHRHLLNKSRDAVRGGHDAWAAQSTGEKLAVALVLNHADWIAEMGYTLAQAIDRVGAEWVAMVPDVARTLSGDEG